MWATIELVFAIIGGWFLVSLIVCGMLVLAINRLDNAPVGDSYDP